MNGYSERLSAAIGQIFEGIAILFLIRIAIIVGVVALITWVVKKVWNAGKEPKKAPREYYDPNDWLSSAQERQNKRYEYTDPPHQKKQQTGRKKPVSEPTWYPSGWTWNEKTQLWEPPDYASKESAEQWVWDNSKQIWVDVKKEKRLERYRAFREREGKGPTFEEWKAAREAEQKAQEQK